MSQPNRIPLMMSDDLLRRVDEWQHEHGAATRAKAIRLLMEAALKGTEMSDAKNRTLTIRLSDEMADRLDKLTKLGPYEVTKTAILERAIVLAEREMEQLSWCATNSAATIMDDSLYNQEPVTEKELLRDIESFSAPHDDEVQH